jgi:hypothetical protein
MPNSGDGEEITGELSKVKSHKGHAHKFLQECLKTILRGHAEIAGF